MKKGVKTTPHNLQSIIHKQQATISYCLSKLYIEGHVSREACPCGRGFVYWK